MSDMRVLGLDIGDRRIGLAICDDKGLLAVPAGTITRTNRSRDVASVIQAATERGAGRIVAGMPYSIDGSLGPQARKVQALIKSLQASTNLPVETIDERYSTAEAERIMRESGERPSRNRGRLDAAAATVILQEYLDRRAAAVVGRDDAGPGSAVV